MKHRELTPVLKHRELTPVPMHGSIVYDAAETVSRALRRESEIRDPAARIWRTALKVADMADPVDTDTPDDPAIAARFAAVASYRVLLAVAVAIVGVVVAGAVLSTQRGETANESASEAVSDPAVDTESGDTESGDTDDSVTGGEGMSGDEAGTTIAGVLTEVFTDCVSHLVLADDGSVDELDAITCDGGSYIVVDQTLVYTASGYVPADQVYSQHDPTLRPGVSVIVVAEPFDGGAFWLNCDGCSLTVE